MIEKHPSKVIWYYRFSNSGGKIMEASVKAVAGGVEKTDVWREIWKSWRWQQCWMIWWYQKASLKSFSVLFPSLHYYFFYFLFLSLPLLLSPSPSLPHSPLTSPATHTYTYVHACIFLTFFNPELQGGTSILPFALVCMTWPWCKCERD